MQTHRKNCQTVNPATLEDSHSVTLGRAAQAERLWLFLTGMRLLGLQVPICTRTPPGSKGVPGAVQCEVTAVWKMGAMHYRNCHSF
jgi:hypothetical protein